MKKLLIVFFSTTVFITAVFGSVFSQDKLFLCRAGELGIYLDNNFEWDQAKDEAIFNLFEKFKRITNLMKYSLTNIIVDYNDDGLNELLLNIGYYEGYSLHIFNMKKINLLL